MENQQPTPANNTPETSSANQAVFCPLPESNPNVVPPVQHVDIPVHEAIFRKEVIAKLDTTLALLDRLVPALK